MHENSAIVSILIDSALSAILFIALWVLLGRRLFGEFLKMLEEREARTEGDQHRAVEKREETKAITRQIEEILAQTRLEGIVIRDEQVHRAKIIAQDILNQAVTLQQHQLEQARNEIEAMRSRALSDISKESSELAEIVMRRVLDRPSRALVH